MKTILLAEIGFTEILIIIVALTLLYLLFRFIYKAFTGNNIESKLKEAKKLYDKKLISEQEYEDMKARLIKDSKI
jgi:hypothetical protein